MRRRAMLAACPLPSAGGILVRTVLACSGVFLLTSCAEQEAESAVKATSETAVSHTLPGYIDCIGPIQQRPGTISLRCSDDVTKISRITWSEWTDERAVGKGLAEAVIEGETVLREDATIELSGPVETPQGRSFATVLIDGDEVIP